ncbi:hypothetical protein ACQKII_24195 [Lysinibacillus sp. NPDC048646]|uniref:hypothetical protein n=1 Tax=Lysinibacillus sp. NPDC048646 TaxID=3390574 RepID=UPI003CFBCE60
MSRGRKHGVFATSGDVVVMPTKNYESKRDCLTIEVALEVVFQQMRIAGNRLERLRVISISLSSSWQLTNLCM